jgi:hypothetical protein
LSVFEKSRLQDREGLDVIRMRGHHLVCLHFFRGHGPSKEFVAKVDEVVGRAEKGEEIEVVEGADDVCRACPALQGERCAAKPDMDAQIREMDREAAAHLGLGVGARVLWEDVKAKVASTPGEWLAAFCEGCDWEKVCAEGKKALGLA